MKRLNASLLHVKAVCNLPWCITFKEVNNNVQKMETRPRFGFLYVKCFKSHLDKTSILASCYSSSSGVKSCDLCGPSCRPQCKVKSQIGLNPCKCSRKGMGVLGGEFSVFENAMAFCT